MRPSTDMDPRFKSEQVFAPPTRGPLLAPAVEKRAGFPLLLFAAFCILLHLAAPVNATVTMAVGLTHFGAIPMDGAVRLNWSTATEINTAAFILKRAEAGGEFVLLEGLGFGGYVIAKGSPVMGADYEEIDDTAVNGTTYTYKLFEIETNTNEVELASVTVTAGLPTATPSPTPQLISNLPTPLPTSLAPVSTPVIMTPDVPAVPNPDIPSPALPTTGVTPIGETKESSGEPPDNAVSEVPDSSSIEPIPANASTAGQGVAAGTGPAAEQGSGVAPDPSVAIRIDPNGAGSESDPGSLSSGAVLAQDAYPIGSETTSPASDSVPYPAGTPTNGNGNVSIIGGSFDEPGSAPTAQQNPRSDLVGRIYLWAGFVIALLVFGASVVGSILLFTRKRE